MFLATALLVFTIRSTYREHLTPTPQKVMTAQDSLDIVTGALKKHGPDGTFSLFDTRLSDYEKLIAQDDNTN